MKIVEPSAKLEWITANADRIIEAAGRTCYRSEAKITDESAGGFIRKIVEAGHESVLEHASASFRLVVDRGVSHELVRHRLASYSQESTRYCDYEDKEIEVIKPLGLMYCGKDVWRGSPPECCSGHIWVYSVQLSCDSYRALRHLGVPPQIARSVLPTCLRTEIVMTANFREWRHVLKQRLSPRAHPQMQQIMSMVADQLVKLYPALFWDVVVDSEYEEENNS